MNLETLSFLGHNFLLNIRDAVDESIVAEIFKHREYRRAEAIIKSAKHAILDVGAHAGFFSLYCKALNSKVKIFAIEPEPNNFTLLNKHIAENGLKGVKTIAAALFDSTGSGELIIEEDSHNHHVLSRTERITGGNLIKIKTFTLADFCLMENITKISLLKMDIEGGEYELLNSLAVADYLMVENIILEYHNYNNRTYKILEQQLRENGFGVQIFPSKFDKKMGFIFANNKRI